MNRDEAIDVLGILTAAWPNARHGDDTVELWIEYLATVGHAEGRKAAAELVLSEEWMPPIARFRQSITATRRHDAERARFAGALPSGEQVTAPDVARARLAELREALR
jgi:hypothetical protein